MGVTFYCSLAGGPFYQCECECGWVGVGWV